MPGHASSSWEHLLTGQRHGDEFPVDASTWPADLSRRRFLELMGASLALAGLTACGRAPRETIVPYVVPPENVTPGRPQFFATVMPWQGYARGILVESHLGRPTKIEGNPDHPESLGATDAVTQAAVLGLYDPDRSRVPLLQRAPASWAAFEQEWLELRRKLDATSGAGLALVTEPTSSPTFLRLLHALLDRMPGARWYQHTALARFDHGGSQSDFDPAAADVILSVGDDFLYAHPASLRYTRAFAARRRVAGSDRPVNRFYAIEPTPTVTGTMADHRLPASPTQIVSVLNALATELGARSRGAGVDAGPPLDAAARHFVTLAARDLRRNAPRVACRAGPEMDESVHRWVDAINAHLGAAPPRRPAVRSDADPRAAGTLPDLSHAIEAGDVQALVILDANPVFTAPADLEFGARLARVPFTAHLGLYVDETAARCRWHLPESHFLETWSDLRGYDGTASVAQPLIEPLYTTHSAHGLLHFLAQPPGMPDYDLVRETWRAATAPEGFEHEWEQWLQAGVVTGGRVTTESLRNEPPAEVPVLQPSATEGDIVLFRADPNVADGRWSNNAWLQELPRPLSRLVWDNAAIVSPAFARAHTLSEGDIVALECDHQRTLELAVFVQPGQADRCVTVHLGYGREIDGAVGTHVGFDAYRLRASASPWQAPLTALRRTGRRHHLVSTQGHFVMEGRDLVRLVTVAEAAGPRVPEHAAPALFPEWQNPRYAWAMVIDLSTCIGCNACIVACQAENNIPVVGKDQVARGREMHWLRVDRYYEGEPENPRFTHQPVPCMQCETAPCELVCPVAATVHSSEGLNDMVYNRCIGTRYCSNNCPYKVRRFNFLDYRPPDESPVNLQKNPEVTIRARGVMEKCTYCVQRINAARIEASKGVRAIRDGEVRTACQQACPAGAIVFGDLHTPGSRVAALRDHALNYALLPELNTRPRTTYLARVVNEAGEAIP